MGSTELAANWFRITQTDETIKNKKVDSLEEANKTHKNVGQEVRKTMKRLSGITPEELPTPDKSIRELQKKEKNNSNILIEKNNS